MAKRINTENIGVDLLNLFNAVPVDTPIRNCGDFKLQWAYDLISLCQEIRNHRALSLESTVADALRIVAERKAAETGK